ncbi:MAG: tandem-95 repeat protein, partial [Sphingomonas sp.]
NPANVVPVPANGTSGIVGTYGTLNIAANGTYSYTANSAAAQALAANVNATDTFTYTARDTGGETSSAQVTITVTGANDAPVIDLNGDAAGIDNTAAYTERAPRVTLAAGLTVSDVDAGARINNASVSITGGLIAGADQLSISGATSGMSGGITYAYDAMSGVLTLSGNGTPAQYQSLLNQVGFASTSSNPGTSRTISWSANDGTASSTAAITTVAVTSINDAPVAVADTAIVNEDATVTRTTRDAGLLGNDTDADTGDQAGLKVVGARAQADASNQAVAGSGATAITGRYGTLNLTANGTYDYTPNSAAAQALAAGAPASEVFTYTVSDTSGDSSSSTLTIAITGQNDAPVLDLNGVGGGIDNAAAYTEDGARATLASGLTVADVDTGANIAGATVSIGAGFLANQDRLTVSGATAGSLDDINYTFNAMSGQLVFTTRPGGTASAAQYQTLLGLVQFDTSSNNPGTSRTIDWSVSDGTATSAVAKTTVAVTPTNDTPTAIADTATVSEDVTAARTTRATGLLGNDTDPDDGDAAALTVATARAGTAGAPVAVPTTSTAGVLDKTAIVGTYGTLNLAADGTYDYTPNSAAAQALAAGAPATETFTYSVKDTGNLTSSSTLTISITGVNDAPVIDLNGAMPAGVDNTVGFIELGAATTLAPDLILTDVDGGTLRSATVTLSDAQAGDYLNYSAASASGLTVAQSE